MVASPFDVVKIRLQVPRGPVLDPGTPRYVLHLVREMCAEEGVRGFYRGNAPALALWASYSAVQFPVYEYAKAALQSATGSPAASWFFAGAAAGITATLVTYPMDYLRTVIAAGEPGLDSIREAAARAHRTNGIFGVYQGARAACTQVVPYVGASFFMYEASMRGLERAHALARCACDPDDTDAHSEQPPPPAAAASVAGAVAGSAAKLFVYPLDTVKRRHQMHHVMQASAGAWRCSGSSGPIVQSVVAIARQEGPRSLYRGAVPAMLKAAPTSAAYFTAYELTGRLVARSRSR